MRAALHAVERDVQFKVGARHEIKDDLAAGRILALPMVARNKERQFDFTAPYLYQRSAIVVRKGVSCPHT
jgi:two-component system sensor histidine kinase EvgS